MARSEAVPGDARRDKMSIPMRCWCRTWHARSRLAEAGVSSLRRTRRRSTSIAPVSRLPGSGRPGSWAHGSGRARRSRHRTIAQLPSRRRRAGAGSTLPRPLLPSWRRLPAKLWL